MSGRGSLKIILGLNFVVPIQKVPANVVVDVGEGNPIGQCRNNQEEDNNGKFVRFQWEFFGGTHFYFFFTRASLEFFKFDFFRFLNFCSDEKADFVS